MSEFKYACPVCGQHIKCDSAQAGTVMQCPTCFQKITVPQAPATDDTKFILTGTKAGDRPATTISEAAANGARRRRYFPSGVLLFVLAVGVAATAAFAFRGEIAKALSRLKSNPTFRGSDEGGTSRSHPARPPKPALVAPPANDTNWMLSLAGVKIPDSRAAGRIHGRDFIVERAFLQNGTLTLRDGTRGPVALGVVINFGRVDPESLANQILDITTNAPKAARVSLRWQRGNQIAHENLASGYAMRLDFGPIQGNRIRGKIYFCAPDDAKSYIVGSFKAAVRKPKPRPR